MSIQSSEIFVAYQAFLVDQQAALAAAVSARCQQQILFYADHDQPALQSNAYNILGLLFELLTQSDAARFLNAFRSIGRP